MNEFRTRWRRIERKMRLKTGSAARHLEAGALLTDSWSVLIRGAFMEADARIAELEARLAAADRMAEAWATGDKKDVQQAYTAYTQTRKEQDDDKK